MRWCLSFSKKKTTTKLKFELVIWDCIDDRFAPLLLLNRTAELSDETPNIRKATMSLKWRLTQNNSGCWAAVLTNQCVIVAKSTSVISYVNFFPRPWPPVSPVVHKAMCWPACVLLCLSLLFSLAVKFNETHILWSEWSGE